MLTRTAAIETVRKFIEQCKMNNILFDKVILFGSFAKNTVKEFSDIDIALVSGSFTHDRFQNALLIAPITIKYPDIDAQTFPTDYFNNRDPFIDEILKTGIEIN